MDSQGLTSLLPTSEGPSAPRPELAWVHGWFVALLQLIGAGKLGQLKPHGCPPHQARGP